MSGRRAEHIHSGRALLGRLAGRAPRLWHRQSEAEIYVAAAAALFGPRKAGLWSMFSAYFDESGTHSGSEFFVLAGLVSFPRKWERLTVQWQRILESEGVGRFHMVDLAHGRGEFSGWDTERKDRMMKRIVPAIRRNVVCRVWSVVRLSDYRQVLEEGLPYSLCAIGCASRLRFLAARHGDHIPYMFEHGGKDSEPIFQAFRELLDQGNADFYRMGPLSIGDPRLCPPLQAADLHAYEVHKFFQDQVRRQGQPRRVRQSFKELLKIEEVGGFFLDLPKLSRFLQGLLAGERPVKITADFLNPQRKYPGLPG